MRDTRYGRLSAYEVNSFAGITVNNHFPQIFKEYCGGNYERFIREAFVAEVFQNPVLDDESLRIFEAKLEPYVGYPLKEFFSKAPFLLVEFYFYHLILEIRDYRCNRFDFFTAKKELTYCCRCQEFRRILTELFLFHQKHYEFIDITGTNDGRNVLFDVLHFLFTDKDLRMLSDDSAAMLHYISNQSAPLSRVDIICNDSGTELFSDIYLACFLLSCKLTEQVVFHVKPYPFLELNATVTDFYKLVAHLTVNGTNKELAGFIAKKQITVRTDEFWVLPCTFDEMSADLNAYFAESSFIVVKGDTNYRRLVRDVQWNYMESFSSKNVLNTVPVAAMRIVMSEVLTGVDPILEDFVREFCPQLNADTRFGMIQCSIPPVTVQEKKETGKKWLRSRK